MTAAGEPSTREPGAEVTADTRWWFTGKALSSGVQTSGWTTIEFWDDDPVWVIRGRPYDYNQAKIGKDVFPTREQAIAKVKKMIAARKASLQRQLAALETMDATTIVDNADREEKDNR